MARKGDVVVWRTETVVTYVDARPSTTYERFHVGTVAAATRDGVVTKVLPLLGSAPLVLDRVATGALSEPNPYLPRTRGMRCWTVDAAALDVPAMIEGARYLSGGAVFVTLDEARAFVARFLTKPLDTPESSR